MAPPIMWLPPLNAHKSFRLEVHIEELSKVEDIYKRRKISIVVNVSVSFYLENRPGRRGFPGLYLHRRALIDVADPESMAASLRRKFLDDNYLIPFPLHSISYAEKRFQLCTSPALQLSSNDDVAGRISRFLLVLDENRQGKMVQAALDIMKLVRLSEDEFKRCALWFKEQQRVHSDFIEEYRRAITQDGREMMCAICLEECRRGTSVGQLLCRHWFHENCILRWFKRSKVCPVCRHSV